MNAKRAFDLMLSMLVLVALSPIMILMSILVFLDVGRPILFCQIRPGKGGELFTMYKFRTMRDDTDEEGKLLPNEARITRIGKFMRVTSLDELPELWNVLRGDMSLVGPRPLLPEYLQLFSERQSRRHEVRPGVTGWAQINGRNNVPWQERLEMDVWYVENRHFLLDCKILALTVLRVIKRENISQPGRTTVDRFKGNE